MKKAAIFAFGCAVLLFGTPGALAAVSIEDLIRELIEDFTIIIVTHNMQQAARVSDFTAFMLAGPDGVGRLVEYGPTQAMFTNPKEKRTEDYITGRFG